MILTFIFRNYFSLISRTELLTNLVSKSSFCKIKGLFIRAVLRSDVITPSSELSEMSDRDFNAACLATHYPVLGERIQYSGAPEPESNLEDGAETGDISISTQDDEGHNLKKECRKWAIRVARETKAINDMEKRLSALKKCSSRAILTRDVSREDVEARVEELEHILRRTRTSKMKEETKLSYLRRELGPEVEKWLADLPLAPGDISGKKVNIEDINRRISVANIIKRSGNIIVHYSKILASI